MKDAERAKKLKAKPAPGDPKKKKKGQPGAGKQ
jgi:hypothetical protein